MARPSESQPLYADDSEQEGEQETPRPHRGAKKRLSDDVSFADSPPRQPLKSRNINDDTAEKRRRRKSTKITIIDNAQAGPSNDLANERDPAETSRTARQKQPLNSVAAPVVEPSHTLEILSSNFDEWMKMATDNKINAGNSWNFALIDYFHDMSLLRNDDGNSINFQRASCTLDGCVKIWTSRVDSVGTETGKLLSNLANDGKDEEDDGNGSDNPDEEATAKRKKSHRPGATLAKDPAQLRSKKLDLEFSVDPLFKKTCADFDEGGAQGLLMNHLSLGAGSEAGLRVIFDASDSVGKVDEDEDMDEPEDAVDLTELRRDFLPDLGVLEEKEISHSLADFSFSKATVTFDDTTFFQDNTQHFDNDDDNDEGGPADFSMNVDADAPPIEDFFVGDDAVHDDYGGDMMGGGTDYGGENLSNGSGMTQEQGPARPGGMIPFDPRRPPNELVMAMTDADGDGGMMDYFDKNFSKNWAGPEHWKMRKVIRRPDADASAKPTTKPRQKKEAFKLDFFTPAEKDFKEITKELFAPVTKGTGINMPGTGPAARKSKKKGKDKEKKDDHSLPDDMHFSSRQLVSLFLKPKFQLKMRGQKVRYNQDGDGEVDENFWAQAAADQAAGRDADDNDATPGGGAIPFHTQFFHDEYDDGPGFDDGYDDGEGEGAAEAEPGEQDLLAATQGKTRRVKPEFVNYTKRAKRVDVRKLKDNIWKGLDIIVPQLKEEDDAMDVDPDEPTPTDPSEARVFSSVISGLEKSYPRDKMAEISTSFCFICLLHLANEQGLKLESSVDDSAPMEPQIEEDVKKVGNIWDLKIYRDPNATQSA
ncbi:condensin complex subunit 2/barren [Mycena maculata]|uniref:Condensin complex subunit 2 n=1 Tax=Mycena maculata TaxID=230809 RepID=A0AAD7IQ36_9AGAR|nr:condensin complex subunit 2/barren [Mycena maculata]